MNKYPKTRKEKINFLKNVLAGKDKISDILPPNVTMWLLQHGQYTNMKTKETLTKKEYLKQKANDYNLLLHELEGCPPLARNESEVVI